MKTLNLKTATIQELCELPNIGVKRAQLIKDKQSSTVYSERINDIYELSGVKGIGKVRMKEILAYIEENNIKIIY